MENKQQKSDAVIRLYTSMSVAAAVVPVPVADIVLITSIQATMIINLGHVYGKTINRHSAKNLVLVVLAASAGHYLASLIKTVPFVGAIVGGILQMTIAGTITYSLGLAANHVLKNDIELNPRNIKDAINKQDKTEIKERQKEIKEKVKKTKRYRSQINFVASSNKFSKNITFHFNVSNFSNIILRIINIEGEIVAEEKIQNKQKQYTFNGEEMDPGQYQASLECDDLIPIAIDIEKE